MVARDRGVLDGAVLPLDLTGGPGAARLSQAMLDLRLLIGALERMLALDARPPWHRPPRPHGGYQ